MSEYTHVSPAKMAFYFFSNHLISHDKYKEIKKASTNPDSDAEEINMDLLMTVYQILKVSPAKIDAVRSALEKLKNSDKHSRSASACSSNVSKKKHCCQI